MTRVKKRKMKSKMEMDEEEDDEEGENGGIKNVDNNGNNANNAKLFPLPSLEDVGDVLKSDMGQGLPFRPASFDGVISISAIQWLWLLIQQRSGPKVASQSLLSALYSVLKRDAKAILQFYPENAEQAYLIAQAASKVGFAGGVLVDYPNSTKAKKYYYVYLLSAPTACPKHLVRRKPLRLKLESL